MFTGPAITKGDGNLGARAASEENIHGMVFGGVLPGSGTYTVLGTTVALIQATDADAMGLTAAYDATNKILVRYHIDEFFRLNKNGKLFIQIVAQTVTMSQMCTLANAVGVTKLINDSAKKVKTVGVIRNPLTGYTPTLTAGLDNDVNTAIPLAQALVEDFILQNCYINHIVIEGREVNGTLASIGDLRTKASPNVHVCILQDKDVANLDALYAKHAAVGTLLGAIGIRRVQEDYGSIPVIDQPNKALEYFSIHDTAAAKWLNPAISSGMLVSALTPAETIVLKARGFIYADSYPEYPGVFFNGSAACTSASSDFAFGVNMRVWNKGARLVTLRLIPKYNSTLETDDNGYISSITAAEWQEDVKNTRNGLGILLVDNNAQKVDCYINPNQAIFSNSTIDVGMTIKPFGYARTITGKLSFSIN